MPCVEKSQLWEQHRGTLNSGKMAVERSRMKQGVVLWGVMMMCMMQPVVRAEEEVEVVNSNLAEIEMKIPNLYPEGFDWDAKHNRFVVSSMAQGRLVTVTEEGAVEEFVKDEEYVGAIMLGVRVDAIHNRVLVVANRASNPRMSALAAYDLDSKTRTLFVDLLEEEDLMRNSTTEANDVAVDGDGNAFVTNSAGNRIWKVSLGGVKTVFVAAVPQQPIVAEDAFVKTVSTNGIVCQGAHLLVGQSNSGAILRVRLDNNKEVDRVRIRDGFVMSGADGMALRSDGSLVVVSLHTAWLLTSRDSWESATVIDTVPLDEAYSTTSAAVDGLRVFTLHSHFPGFFKGLDHESFKILEIKFPADEHDNPLWLLAIVGFFVVLVLAWKFQMNQFDKAYTKKRA